MYTPTPSTSSILLTLFSILPVLATHHNLPRHARSHPQQVQAGADARIQARELDERLLPITATTTVVVDATVTQTIWVMPTDQAIFVPSGSASASDSISTSESASPTTSTTSTTFTTSTTPSASASASQESASESGSSSLIVESASESPSARSSSGSSASPTSSASGPGDVLLGPSPSVTPSPSSSSSVTHSHSSEGLSSSASASITSSTASPSVTESASRSSGSNAPSPSRASGSGPPRSAPASSTSTASSSTTSEASSILTEAVTSSELSTSESVTSTSESASSSSPSAHITSSASVSSSSSTSNAPSPFRSSGSGPPRQSPTATSSSSSSTISSSASAATAVSESSSSTITSDWASITSSIISSVTEEAASSSSFSSSAVSSSSSSSIKASSTSSASSSSSTLSTLGSTIMNAYYPDWSAWHLTPEQVDWSLFDTVDFAFALPTSDGNLQFTQDDSSDLLTRLVSTGHAAGKRVKLSIGGWTGSAYFSTICSDSSLRATFVSNILKAYNAYNLDGIDIDWEYPGTGGASGNAVSSADSAHFLLFLQELRAALPTDALITAATQVWPFAGSNGQPLSDVSAFAQVLDWILIMNYDIWGSSSTPGPNAPLSDACGNSTQPLANAYAAVSSWTTAGMPAQKITLGVPAYGYLQKSGAGSLRTRRSFPSPPHRRAETENDMKKRGSVTVTNDSGGDDDGQVGFQSILSQGALASNGAGGYNGANGFTRHWDSCSSTPWLKSTSSGQIITYDDPESMSLKGQFAAQAGIRGCNIFSIDGDWTGSGWPLTDAVRSGLGL